VDSRYRLPLSRRQVIRGLLATGAFGITVRLGTGCTSTSESQAGAGGSDQPILAGFIYVGSIDDYGWNQSHYQGEEALSQVSWVKTERQAKVPETTDVEETMRNMIEQDGASIIFATSYGYYDYVLKVAPDYPKVQFFHAGGLYKDGDPQNVGTYFGYIDGAQYVAGIVAGHTSKTGKLGFIAAKPIPQVLRNINSYTLGAQSVKPDITTQAIFTGDWFMPVKEAEAANSMADQGIDVLTCHVDSPKVIMETATKRGIYCTGYHTNQAALAAKHYLTGAEWHWSTIYQDYAEMIHTGKSLIDGGIPHSVRGGLEENYVQLSDYGPAVSAAAKQDADAAKAKLNSGDLVIYQGPIKDNTGKVVIANGKAYPQADPTLEKMDWLVSGVQGSVSS